MHCIRLRRAFLVQLRAAICAANEAKVHARFAPSRIHLQHVFPFGDGLGRAAHRVVGQAKLDLAAVQPRMELDNALKLLGGL